MYPNSAQPCKPTRAPALRTSLTTRSIVPPARPTRFVPPRRVSVPPRRGLTEGLQPPPPSVPPPNATIERTCEQYISCRILGRTGRGFTLERQHVHLRRPWFHDFANRRAQLHNEFDLRSVKPSDSKVVFQLSLDFNRHLWL
jgi:hypothetical protein